jgi:predicted phosphodiesterase
MVRAVVLSDLHLVYGGTEVVAVETIIDRLESNPPDELIINGDLYELWRGDLAGMMWLTSRFTDMLVDLRDRGVKITYLQGNHDDYLSRHLDDNPDYPFDQQLDYRTTFDGVDFFFTHGHKYEPTYLPPTNDALAVTDDHAGNLADRLWDARPAPGNPIETVALAALGPAAGFFNPDGLQQNNLRRKPIEVGIRANTAPDEWGVIGHTHVPYVDEEERIANSGSFTSGQATYLVIENGEVTLNEVAV